MTAHILRRLCPPSDNAWIHRLRYEATKASIGAGLRKAQADIAEEEAGVLMKRYHESEARNHFRERVESQFGKGVQG